MEKITVLIPTYNRAKYIKISLTSILEQTYGNLEILIYDDGSTDNTLEIIKGIRDPRIKIIKGGKNKGPTVARNALLDACQTKYACWHDSDDLSNIHRIKTQLQYLQRNPKSLVATKHQRIGHIDQGKFREKPKDCKKGGSFASMMFEINKEIRFDNQRVIGGEDTRWVKAMINNGYKKVILDKCLYYVLIHSDRISQKKKIIRQKLLGKEVDKENTSYKDLLDLL